MDNLETLNSRLICVWLHVFCVARKERAFPLYNKAHSFLSLSLSLLPWITADVHRVFCRLYFGFLSRPRVAACKKRLLMRVGTHTGFVADVYDLKVRRWQIASKLLFFHEVSVARGQGLSPRLHFHRSAICQPCFLSIIPRFVTKGNSRHGNRNRFQLCCTIMHIVLFSRIPASILSVETLGFHELHASRMDMLPMLPVSRD